MLAAGLANHKAAGTAMKRATVGPLFGKALVRAATQNSIVLYDLTLLPINTPSRKKKKLAHRYNGFFGKLRKKGNLPQLRKNNNNFSFYTYIRNSFLNSVHDEKKLNKVSNR